MCRTYETKEGPYTRLCYRTGRRGHRVPGRKPPDRRCWPFSRATGLLKREGSAAWRRPIRRCTCGGDLDRGCQTNPDDRAAIIGAGKEACE